MVGAEELEHMKRLFKVEEKDERIAELEKKVGVTKAGINMLSELARRKDARIDGLKAEMKEIHHRVKNGFQVVASMLNMQAREAKSDVAKEAIQSARSRILTMARVYEQLQQSGDVRMRALVTGIVSQYEFAQKARIDIPEDMVLPAKIAIPCAQIINELVSNSYKHTFPDDLSGEVEVAMEVVKGRMSLGFSMDGKLTEGDEIKLIVSDNGVGFPIDAFEAKSMGMTIVKSLIKQIDGKMEVDHKNGTKFTIRFEI